MNWAPRITLRNIFSLFLCAAVGLATDSNPLAAIEPAVATAMVIGLIQQTRQLSRLRAEQSELAFARHFAIAWRSALAATMAVYLAGKMAATHRFIYLPERDEMVHPEPFAYVLSVCILIVLLDSLARWRSNAHGTMPRRRHAVYFSILAILITTIMLVEGMTIEYLVHRALGNIEASSPKHLLRPGIYPKLAEEGYFTFWIALGAAACVIGAAAAVARLRYRRSSGWWQWTAFCAVLAMLAPPLTFCLWYYNNELHRLSPEIAGAGLALAWWDWLLGAWIGFVLISALAYQLAKVDSIRATIDANLLRGTNEEPLHETFPCLLLLAGNSFYALSLHVIEFVRYSGWFGGPSTIRFISMLCYPPTLLAVATFIACLQFCWYRWRRRRGTISWQLSGLSMFGFWRGWIALTILLVIGIPAARAFSFILWLGPVDLYHLFGYP